MTLNLPLQVSVISGFGSTSVSGNVLNISGAMVVISGGAGSPQISGTVIVSGFVSGSVKTAIYFPSPADMLSGDIGLSLVDVKGRPAVRIDTFTIMAPVDIQAHASGIYLVSGEAVTISGNYVGVMSGVTLPISIVSGYIFATSKTMVSGAALITVTSGLTTLKSIVTGPISGGCTTYSGQLIRVNDATSGMAAQESGTMLYEWSFGTHSGLNLGAMPASLQPPSFIYDVVCYSGIVVQGAAGWRTTVIYTKN